MALSDWAEEKLLDHAFGITSWTVPATVYAALFTAAPSDTGGGTEVTGGSYARVAITNNGTGWSRTNQTVDNDADITFPTATASWGTCTHVGIFDAATVGNLIWWGALSSSLLVDNGQIAKFPAGDLDFNLD